MPSPTSSCTAPLLPLLSFALPFPLSLFLSPLSPHHCTPLPSLPLLHPVIHDGHVTSGSLVSSSVPRSESTHSKYFLCALQIRGAFIINNIISCFMLYGRTGSFACRTCALCSLNAHFLFIFCVLHDSTKAGRLLLGNS